MLPLLAAEARDTRRRERRRRRGLATAVIEGGDEIGGLCILRGCMPSKALLYAAEMLHLARAGKPGGLRIPRAGFDFPGGHGAQKGN